MFSAYDTSALFEKTANGVHLNTAELERLNAQLNSDAASKYREALARLNEQLASEKEILAGLDEANANYNIHVETIGNLQSQINEVELLASQWGGAPSAYNEYVTAQSGGNERDSFENIAKSKDEMQKLIDQGWYGDKSLTSYLGLMLGKDRVQDNEKAWKQLDQKIAGTKHSLTDYFTFEAGNLVTNGLSDFLDDINAVLGDEYAGIDKNGKYFFDLTGDKLQEVADRFGTSTEMIELMARALADAGMTVNFDDTIASTNQLHQALEEARSEVEKLQNEGAISKI